MRSKQGGSCCDDFLPDQAVGNIADQQGNELAGTYIQKWYTLSSHLYSVKITDSFGPESETVHRAVQTVIRLAYRRALHLDKDITN